MEAVKSLTIESLIEDMRGDIPRFVAALELKRHVPVIDSLLIAVEGKGPVDAMDDHTLGTVHGALCCALNEVYP